MARAERLVIGEVPESAGLLPPGRQLAVTWGIPDAFGGMTSALLHRSRAFVRLAGRPVDVLTFDPQPGTSVVRERLEREGRLIDGMSLRNVYDDLRERPPAPLPLRHEPPRPQGTASRAPGPGSATAPDGAALLVRHDDEGVRRLEHRRADGSIAVIDERARPDGPRRLLTAFDHDERPVRQWTGAWQCYADWLDGIVGDERAFAIVDSKAVARFVAEVRRPNLVTMHVVHNAHLVGPDRPLGLVRPSRRAALARMEWFDAVVFLTERQRADAAALLSDPGNLEVIPNATTLPPPEVGAAPRDPGSLVVVAGLTRRKRVHHAIDVVRLAREAGAPVRLAIHGDGPELERLRAASVAAGVGSHVTFAGHTPDAAEAFAAASVTLLTSTSEGAPLVLLEAMARGCLPVAYDIAYGPADLIVDGVNGFLVPDGDRAAAAAAVRRAVDLPEAARERMRAAARATAAGFDDAAVTAAWGEAQRRAWARHARPRFEVPCALDGLRVRRPAASLRVSARFTGLSDAARITVRLENRRSGALLRRTVPVRHGRLALRLSPAETDFLGRGRIAIGFDVTDGDGRAEVDGAEVHPDTRSLPRRARHALRRLRGSRRPGEPRRA